MKQSDSFPTTGLFLGFTIAAIFAVITFAISKNFVITISVAVPIGITLGIGIEEKLRGRKKTDSRPGFLIGLLSLGVAIFVALMFFTQTI